MVNEVWKKEFRSNFLRLQHDKPQQFVLCQWQSTHDVKLTYIVYKWLMAVIFLVTMICSICDVGRPDYSYKYIKWGIYLTNWGFTLCTIQSFVGAGLVTQQFLRQKENGNYLPVRKRLPVGYQLYWIIHTIAVVLALGITICYWGTVYDPKEHTLDALNILVHACNSVLMLIDFLIVAHPFRLLHCYLPFVFTGIYLIFNCIYYHLGGTDRHEKPYIYPLLDWRRPTRALLAAIFGLVFILGVHGMIWALFLMRRVATSYFVKKEDKDASEETTRNNGASIQMESV